MVYRLELRKSQILKLIKADMPRLLEIARLRVRFARKKKKKPDGTSSSPMIFVVRFSEPKLRELCHVLHCTLTSSGPFGELLKHRKRTSLRGSHLKCSLGSQGTLGQTCDRWGSSACCNRFSNPEFMVTVFF